MSLTVEQQNVVNTAVTLYNKKDSETLLVSACAGAGKTHTLIELAKAINPKTALYLAYNKKIQLEAAGKFKGTRVQCKTMHGLAYGKTVKKYGLDLNNFTYRDITEKIPYEDKQKLVSLLESFLLSGSLDIDKYLEERATKEVAAVILKYYSKMMHGEVGGGHSFYLKLYHILLANGTIQSPDLDLLMVDEMGDITALTIEIFKLIQAKLKVGVGDSAQNIYSFNHTVNGFKLLEKESTILSLTQSFRVADIIAYDIESFCRRTFDPSMQFTGRAMTGKEKDTSHCYISRNNAGLISKMFYFEMRDIPFNLTRDPKDIFGLILALSSLKPGKSVFDPRYKWLEKVAITHSALVKQNRTKATLLKYIMEEYAADTAIKGAINVIMTHGAPALFDVYEKAKKHRADKKEHYVTLTTCHAVKGMEYTSVTILPDLNKSASDAIRSISWLSPSQDAPQIEKLNEELRLYYVAASRAQLHLYDADSLKPKLK